MEQIDVARAEVLDIGNLASHVGTTRGGYFIGAAKVHASDSNLLRSRTQTGAPGETALKMMF